MREFLPCASREAFHLCRIHRDELLKMPRVKSGSAGFYLDE